MKFKAINSIRLKLTLWYGLVVGIIFFLSGLLLYGSIKKSLLNEVDSKLFDTVHEVEHAISISPETKWAQIAQQTGDKFQLTPPFVKIIKIISITPFKYKIAAQSRTLAESNIKLPIQAKVIKPIFTTNLTYSIQESIGLSDYPYRILYYPVSRKNKPDFIILSAISMHGTLDTLQKLVVAFLIIGPFVIFLVSIGGYFMIKKAMLPVKAVVDTARKISSEDLSHRIEVQNCSSEIKELIYTFNQMISRLEGYVTHIKRFTSDVSHDLRTPLTIIRGEIEVTLRKTREIKEYKDVMRSSLEEVTRLENIINSLLIISRMEAQSKAIPLLKISLDKIVLSISENWKNTAKKKGLILELKQLDSFFINGNETLLNSLVANLIENAVKFTSMPGRVEIFLKKINHTAILSIKDTGIGIPNESLPHVFERFYRVDIARSNKISGFGLGLATVKHVADIHSASVDVKSQLNAGSVFTIRFPEYSLSNNSKD